MADAQLVISRSGASSVADISVIGRPAILVPFAAATHDHQTANARGLVQAGAAIQMPEAKLTVAKVTETILSVLADAQTAQRMAQAALDASRPDATEALAAMVENLAQQHPSPQQKESTSG